MEALAWIRSGTQAVGSRNESGELATRDAKTGPDSDHHATLRAKIVAFGSHDMTRAFDRWSEAYRMVLGDKGDNPCCVDPVFRSL